MKLGVKPSVPIFLIYYVMVAGRERKKLGPPEPQRKRQVTPGSSSGAVGLNLVI